MLAIREIFGSMKRIKASKRGKEEMGWRREAQIGDGNRFGEENGKQFGQKSRESES